MDLDQSHPAISDLRERARRRLPRFVWDYLDSATGREATARRNRDALDAVLFRPAVLRGEVVPDLSVRLLGQEFALPFGVAPVGMSGLVWPGAECILARTARETGMAYTLSTVAAASPEEVGPDAGGVGQVFRPREEGLQIPAVGRDGVRRELQLSAQVDQELGQQDTGLGLRRTSHGVELSGSPSGRPPGSGGAAVRFVRRANRAGRPA